MLEVAVSIQDLTKSSPESLNHLSVCSIPLHLNLSSDDEEEEIRIKNLKLVAYGITLPIVCILGVIGNLLNLLVLRNMNGVAYIYMRGYAVASLLAIIFAIPFGLRVLTHSEVGQWNNLLQAFYHVHLELYVGNSCLGVGVLMLLALTVERYTAVCHLAKGVSSPRKAKLIVAIIPIVTFLFYLPNVFRSQLIRCSVTDKDKIFLYYQKNDNFRFLQSPFYSIYKIALEVIFKVGPTMLLVALNLRILIAYRKSCARRRQRRGVSGKASNQFAEERRLTLLLGSTSILFFICVSPMVILNVTLSQRNLTLFYYQVFRAIANVLEVMNYSLTFYIYCLFSKDFRSTLTRTLSWPWCDNNENRNLPLNTERKVNGEGSPFTQMSTTPTPLRACTLTCGGTTENN